LLTRAAQFPQYRRYLLAICGVLLIAILFSVASIKAPQLIPFLAGLIALLLCAAALYLKRTGRDQKIKLLLYPLFERAALTRKKDILLGRLDGCIDGELYGWALDPREPSGAPKLTLYAENRPVAEVLPVQYRPDIGKHAFYFDLSPFYLSNQRIDARFFDGRLVPNSPLVVSTPAPYARSSEAVLFMHIAKTAGTAFREAIAENYKQSEIAYLYPDPPGLLTYKLELLPVEQRRGFRLVIGHFQYGMHDLLPQECKYVTIVREPVARIISHYRYIVEKQYSGAVARMDSAASLIEMLERRETVNLDNLMVRCFAGVDEKDVPPGHINEDVYALAVQHLENDFSFVGYQERANQAYVALQQRFHWKPRAALENVNKSRLSGKQKYESARAAIEHFNHWDCRLYARIRELFP
jgi:hypothetical protein